jgi:hypothetical protein
VILREGRNPPYSQAEMPGNPPFRGSFTEPLPIDHTAQSGFSILAASRRDIGESGGFEIQNLQMVEVWLYG